MTVRILAGWLLVAGGVYAQTLEARSEQALDLLFSGKVDDFYGLFSADTRARVSLAIFAEQLRPILGLRQPVRHDPGTAKAVGGYTQIVIRVRWTAAVLDAVLIWNAAGELAATNFRPPEPPPWVRPAYSMPDSFTAAEVTVGDDEWKLPGTLLVPKGAGPFAGVVLVGGSGAPDRDGAVHAAKVFRDLAEGLASRGIAVLRYDSRKRVYPKCAADPDFTLDREKVDDAVRAAALLRRTAGIDPARVFVLGHSLGGYATPRIMKADPRLTGAIILAGNSRPYEQVMLDQVEYDVNLKGGEPSPEDRARIETARKNPLAAWGAKYVADLKGYDPAAMANSSTTPLLILQGERDFQITMKDFAGWKAGLTRRGEATLRSYPGLNHLFIAGDGKPTAEEYEQAGHVAAAVIGDVAEWILRAKPSTGTGAAK
jgi:uncharacterized protein